ncbi:hypothetical protein KKG38_00400 [Patescibacteria group bacterium]|nr:hypothetical protein [Patescibacteria group bacterium]MBU1901060.1 hypothetical protein [Patescibacteria group bacterium]
MKYYNCDVLNPDIFEGYLTFHVPVDIPVHHSMYLGKSGAIRVTILEIILQLRIQGWRIYVY